MKILFYQAAIIEIIKFEGSNMSDNPYVKSLKPFDPRKNLVLNETFKIKGVSYQSDTLSDLESGNYGDTDTGMGKEVISFKTGSGILSGLVKIQGSSNRQLILCCNKGGEIYLLSPEGKNLKPVLKVKIQGSINRMPSYSDGIIYCTTREGMIYAISTGITSDSKAADLHKPQILWKKKMAKGILTESIATGKSFITATLGGIYGFEAYFKDITNKSIGKPLWAFSLNGIVSSPRLESGLIYLGAENKNIYAFEYGGSKISKVWAYKLSGACRSKPCTSKSSDLLLVPTIDGFLYALSRSKGEYKWNVVVKSPVLSNVVSGVIDGQECFYFGADNGVFYCINIRGKKVWHFKTNGKVRTEALIERGMIFFGSEDNKFYALNAKTGKEVFTFSTDGNINSKPVIIDNVVYFGSTDSFLHGVQI